MSNFQELQADKLQWNLSNDEALFEKMQYMQDNVLASAHLITSSMQELDRAIDAAGTTLSNAINAFNQLNHTKFLENVVEEMDQAEKRAEVDRMNQTIAEQNQSMLMGDIDCHNEKDKILFALELAIDIANKKSNKGGAEDDEDPDETVIKEKAEAKKNKENNYLGTSRAIKLPFVIGTPEFYKHPYAGMVYIGSAEDQKDHFVEEQEQLKEDKLQEEKELQENAEEVAQVDRAIEQEQQLNVANIPPPPEGDLGNIPPPPGYGFAYVPALVAGGVMPTSEQKAKEVQQKDEEAKAQIVAAQNAADPAGQNLAVEALASAQVAQSAGEKDDPYANNALFVSQRGGGWRDRRKRESQVEQPSNMFAEVESQPQQAQKPDLSAMMNAARAAPITTGGLFGAGALAETENTDNNPAKAGLSLFDDGEDEVSNQPSLVPAPARTPAQPAPKKKTGGLFGDDSDEEEFGIKPSAKKNTLAVLEDSDNDEDDFVPVKKTAPSKTVQQPAAKKNAFLDSEESDEQPVVPKSKPSAAPPQKQAPAKKKNAFLDSEEEEDDDFMKPPAAKKPSPAPVEKPAPKKKNAFLDSDSEDEEDLFAKKKPAPAAPVQETPSPPKPAPKKSAFLDSDDEEEEEDLFKKPAAKPQAAPPKAAPPKKQALLESDPESDDNIPVAPKKQAAPPKAPEPAPQAEFTPPNEEQEPPRKSMAELAAMINVAAISQGANSAANPLVQKRLQQQEAMRTTITRESVSNNQSLGMTASNGEIQHANFAAKPQMTQQRKARNVKVDDFFSSDDEENTAQPSYDYNYGQQEQYYQQDATNSYNYDYQQQESYEGQYSQQVQPEATQSQQQEYQQQQYHQEEPKQVEPERQEEQPKVSKPSGAAALLLSQQATKAKATASKKKKKSKFMESDDEESSSDEDSDSSDALPAPVKKPTPAPVQTPAPVKQAPAAQPQARATQPKAATKNNFLDSDEDESDDDFLFKPKTQVRQTQPAKPAPVQPKASAAKGKLWESESDEDY